MSCVFRMSFGIIETPPLHFDFSLPDLDISPISRLLQIHGTPLKMTALSNSLVLARNSQAQLSSGYSFKPADLGILGPTNLSFSPLCARKNAQKHLVVQAAYSDSGRSSSASIFVGGFILGGLVVGTLGCVYAPQISKALAGADKKDLMRKLPKFIYDEEKALEKTRKILTEKIEQLNSAIDDVSAQLRSEGTPNGAAVNSDEVEGIEAAI